MVSSEHGWKSNIALLAMELCTSQGLWTHFLDTSVERRRRALTAVVSQSLRCSTCCSTCITIKCLQDSSPPRVAWSTQFRNLYLVLYSRGFGIKPERTESRTCLQCAPMPAFDIRAKLQGPSSGAFSRSSIVISRSSGPP